MSRKVMSELSRRDLFRGAAGLTLALTVTPDPLALIGGMTGEARADAPASPNVWVSIATDGNITIVSPAAEMGQGTFTTLPAVFADEFDADWSKVRPITPPEWNEKKFGNPGYNDVFQTSASAAVRGYFKAMRIAGAQARRVLIDAVAAKWNVPASELSTEPSIVVHAASGRRISYGEIAGFAKAPAELPKIEDKDLKPASQFRLIGKDVARVDVPLKVMGAAKYAMDAQVDGMVYAAVLQSPYPGGAPVTIDDARARKVAGVTDIVKLPEGVGVIGTSVEATQAAKNLLKVTWSDAPGAHHDSERGLDELAAIGRNLGQRRRAVLERRRRARDHGQSGQGVPRRLPHPLRLSRSDGAPELHRRGCARREVGGDLGRHPRADEPARAGRPPPRHRPQQNHAAPAFPGRCLRPARLARGGARCGAPVESSRQAGEARLVARGRHRRRQVPTDDGASHRGRLRRGRQARRLAPPRGFASRRSPIWRRAPAPHRPSKTSLS